MALPVGQGGEEDEVAAVKSKRARLTPDVVIGKFELLLGAQFRGLSQQTQPEAWAAKLVKLYESWADAVFPQIPFDTFLRRLEAMSSRDQMKEALWHLSVKRAKIEEQEAIQQEEAEIEAARQGQPINHANTNNSNAQDEEEEDDLVLVFSEDD